MSHVHHGSERKASSTYGRLFTIVALAGLTACATNYATRDATSVAAAVTVHSSKLDATTTYVGPNMEVGELLRTINYGLIRSSRDGGHMTSLAVNFIYTGVSWAFYESANFEGGDVRGLLNNGRTVIECSRGTCSYLEKTLLILPEGYIEDRATTGFSVRLNSRNRPAVVINVPAEYIKGFLAAIPR